MIRMFRKVERGFQYKAILEHTVLSFKGVYFVLLFLPPKMQGEHPVYLL